MKNYFILPHAFERKLLLLQGHGGRTLPHFDRREPIHRGFHEVNDAVSERYGVAVRTLRYVAHGKNPENATGLTVYECENLSPQWVPPTRSEWARLEEIEGGHGVDPAQLQIIRRWLSGESDSANGLPAWMKPGWYGEATEWIQHQLSAHGQSLAGPVRQFRVSAISCLLEVPANDAECFFKAVPDLFCSETTITARMGPLYPQNIPSLIAVDHDRHWMLMRRLHGAHLDDTSDVELWKRVVRRLAEIQTDFVGRTRQLLEWGCMDRPLSVLPEQFDRLCGAIEDSTKWKLYGLDEEMVRLLIPLARQIRGWCEELAAFGLPETLIHGDLHAGNFILKGEHPVFYDWSDAAITHPFFDMLILMNSERPDRREEVKTAYLEPWRAHSPTPRLGEVFELGLKVAHVYHSLSYLRLTENLAPEMQWEMADGVGFPLQKLLEGLGLYARRDG